MAAENVVQQEVAAPGERASMRPRRMAAENVGRRVSLGVRGRVASMRPRRMAAENR